MLNVIYKIITKVLTVRLTKIARKVIGESQTAFIPGRYISDGVVVLHEVLHELQRKKEQGIVLKLGFEKAYDKVRWSFFAGSAGEEEFFCEMDRLDYGSCNWGQSCYQPEW